MGVQSFEWSWMYFFIGYNYGFSIASLLLIIHVWDDMFEFDEDLAASLIDDNDGGIIGISNGLTCWLSVVSI